MLENSTIWLARHGKTLWNLEGRYQGRKNSPLTPEGVAQAKAVGTFLSDKNIEIIFTSPLGRAIETTLIIQKMISVDWQIMPEIAEMSFGLFEEQLNLEMKQQHPDFFSIRQDPTKKVEIPYPEGESYQDVMERITQPILSLLGLEKEILVVAHNSVNRVIRSVLLGKELINAVNLHQENNQIMQINPNHKKEEIHNV